MGTRVKPLKLPAAGFVLWGVHLYLMKSCPSHSSASQRADLRAHCCGAKKTKWSWKLLGASSQGPATSPREWSQCPRTQRHSENSLWVWTLFSNNGMWRNASWGLDEAVFFFQLKLTLLTAESWERMSSSFACLLFTQTVTCFISIFQKHAGSLPLNDHPLNIPNFYIFLNYKMLQSQQTSRHPTLNGLEGTVELACCLNQMT